MRFFSKLVFICNVCFLLALIFRLVEMNNDHTALIPLPWLEGSIVILGFIVAVLLNAAFVFIFFFRKSIRRSIPVHRYVTFFNLIVFPIQIWQQFFSNL